jgi:hypothetical protein
VGPCFMNVVALGLHYGARTGLYQEDPRSQIRDLGTRPICSEFSRNLRCLRRRTQEFIDITFINQGYAGVDVSGYR